MTNQSLANEERKVPAPLVLPFGKLFFGYTYKPYDPSKDTKKVEPEDGAGVSRSLIRFRELCLRTSLTRPSHSLRSQVRGLRYPEEVHALLPLHLARSP